jgi:NAD(P)-dependent dehydrogenase (short-subunit alcohol dehydrogenase family)
MADRLIGRVALVTGGGQGIGRGIALALAAEGADVTISGRRAEPLEQVVKEIEARGGTARTTVGDVGERADAERMVAETVAAYGRLDALINNAQSSVQRFLSDTTDDDVMLAFRTGALGSLYTMQAAFPYLKERGGSIVNFGSSTAITGDASFGSYAMAKEAIRGLSRVAATEWGRFGIRVNTVVPSAMSPAAEEWRDRHPETFASHVKQTPLGRLGDCEADIGRAVAALVSDDMQYLTGGTLMLGGGRNVQ